MRVLFVEDDKTQVQLLYDAVQDWNGKNADRLFEITTASDVEVALSQLEALRIDAALFDLKLPSHKGEKAAAKGGNKLAKATLDSVGVPVAVISGNPADLDADLAKHQFLQRFNKGDVDVYSSVISWLGGLWALMSLLAETRSKVRKSGAEIFVKRLWPRWQEYTELAGIDVAELGHIVSRQYVGHIADSLATDGTGDAFWHPYEAYVRPALLENRAHTGDIFSIDNKLWVVLSPQCDMANANINDVLLAEVDNSKPDKWDARIADLANAALGAGAQKDRDKYFQDFVNQNKGNAKHFLPPLNRGEPPLTVLFSKLATRPLAELNGRLGDRQASVASAFLPNLVQRFGAFISRTGQPNIAPKYFQ